jgi:hypothetical protein
MKYSKTVGNKREVAIGTAHTVTVNSLNETNKQNKQQTNVYRALGSGGGGSSMLLLTTLRVLSRL